MNILDYIIQIVRLIKAKKEERHEKLWAKKLLKSNNIDETLNRYYNFSLSQWHTQQEFKIVSKYCSCKKKCILFIGSGALPITPIHFCRDFNITVECIDLDSKAIWLSQRLVNKLQIGQYFKFHNTDVTEFFTFKEVDFIVVAAMAGVCRNEKQRIVQHLAKNVDRNIPIIFRTAFGIKKFWISNINKKDLNQFKTRDEYRKISSCFVDSIIITMN